MCLKFPLPPPFQARHEEFLIGKVRGERKKARGRGGGGKKNVLSRGWNALPGRGGWNKS